MSAITTVSGEYAGRELKLLESYNRTPGAFDEMSTESGELRPRWQRVLEAFAAMGTDATKAAQDKAQRLLLENGVTFVAQGDRDQSRPWRLDLFPCCSTPPNGACSSVD